MIRNLGIALNLSGSTPVLRSFHDAQVKGSDQQRGLDAQEVSNSMSALDMSTRQQPRAPTLSSVAGGLWLIHSQQSAMTECIYLCVG